MEELQTLIPGFQPVPLPGPLWLLNTLLIAGFYLHALPMNVALTGGLVAAMFLIFGKARQHMYAVRLGNALAFSLPFFVSFAITMGVVPLLFLQLVYGPLFYTSSILMAVPWILVIFLLLSAYYSYYIFTYRRLALGNRAPWVLVAAGLIFLVIAFFFTNNMTLMLMPEHWTAMYRQDPYGFNLNWGTPQLWPRYLHFVLAAMAVTSLVIGSFGLYWHRRERDYGQWLIRAASTVFLLVTLLQFPVGVWFLLSLPYPIMMNYLGGDPAGTVLFGSAMAMAMVALIAMFLANRSGSPRPYQVGLVATLLVVLLMSNIRHLLRVYYTSGFFEPGAFETQPQWLLIGLFVAGATLLIAYLIWLVRITWQAFHPPAGTSRETVGEAL